MMSRRVWSAAVTRRSERSPATRCEAGRSALPAGRAVRLRVYSRLYSGHEVITWAMYSTRQVHDPRLR
jgi:hypothetical protein